MLRVDCRAPGQRRAAGAAEMSEGFIRRTVSGRASCRHLECQERYRQPGDDRGTVCPLAHPAMAVERLDGCCGDAVAYRAAKAPAAQNLVHPLTSVDNKEPVHAFRYRRAAAPSRADRRDTDPADPAPVKLRRRDLSDRDRHHRPVAATTIPRSPLTEGSGRS